MHTESEAKKLWCPFARGIQDASGNRMAYGGDKHDGPDSDDCAEEYAAEMAAMYPCIASACAAWRWAEDRTTAYANLRGYIEANERINAIKEWRKIFDASLKDGVEAIDKILAGQAKIPTIEERGYCGLAGNP